MKNGRRRCRETRLSSIDEPPSNADTLWWYVLSGRVAISYAVGGGAHFRGILFKVRICIRSPQFRDPLYHTVPAVRQLINRRSDTGIFRKEGQRDGKVKREDRAPRYIIVSRAIALR